MTVVIELAVHFTAMIFVLAAVAALAWIAAEGLVWLVIRAVGGVRESNN